MGRSSLRRAPGLRRPRVRRSSRWASWRHGFGAPPGLDGEPNVELLGIRRGETMAEVLTGAGERLGAELYPGIVEIEAEVSTDAASWVAERIGAETSREAAREVWREAMGRPGLIVPV